MLKIKCLRNILLLSLALAVLLPLYMILYIHPSYRTLLTEQTEKEAVRYVRHLVRTLDLDRQMIDRARIPANITEEIDLLRNDDALVKLKIFAPSGEVVFSTDREEIGKVNRKPYFQEIVAKGRVFSKVVGKNLFTAEHQRAKTDVVETYVPIMVGGAFGGAIETYFDISASREKIVRLSHRSNLLILTVSPGLLLVLLFALHKAGQAIEKRQLAEEAAKRANADLEAQVARRTDQLSRSNDQLLAEIAERRRVEEALRQALREAEEAAEKIDGILRSVADGLLVTDERRRVVLMNSAAEQMLRSSLPACWGEPVEAVIHDPVLLEKVARALEQRQDRFRFDFTLPRNGSAQTGTFQGRTSVISGKNGESRGMIILFQDVTREREMDRLKREFFAMAAHELQTPLTAIIGYAELLVDDYFGRWEPAQQKEFLSFIHRKGLALSRIVDDLLDISRVEAGLELHLEKRAFPVWDMLLRIVAHHRDMQGSHLLEARVPPESRVIRADPDRINQVLENLLSNALKYSPAGGRVRVSGEILDGAQLQITVEDEGVGMTPEQAGRVFDKFYRAENAAPGTRGTGLGLSIAKHIIELHGGEISLRSEPGKGTAVRFTLPLDAPEGG